jgi:hypothetical protein
VEQYAVYRQVGARELNSDVSAMQKSERMAEDATLAVSFLQPADRDVTFLSQQK